MQGLKKQYNEYNIYKMIKKYICDKRVRQAIEITQVNAYFPCHNCFSYIFNIHLFF